ncbi:MAG TPA: DUF3575 domain-containing protein [Bacteroidia bacterium]|nr:DUF3575 domain-containing protein [Bacteroidia bacterium]
MNWKIEKFAVVLVCLFSFMELCAQQETPDILVVYGVDCSMAKIVTRNEYNPDSLIKNDIPSLNREMVKICNQFKERFWTKQLLIDTTDVNRINSQRSATSLLVDSRYQFTNGDANARAAVKNCNTSAYKDKDGVGFLIVMEKIDERADRESFYIVLFELERKKIIHCEKVEVGLSKIKNMVGSGWFSWKTGIFRTIEAMSDIYDFWNSYPEKEKIDITTKNERYNSTYDHPIVEKRDTTAGMKKAKIVMLDAGFPFLGTDLTAYYIAAFPIVYKTNDYWVSDATSWPKFNLSLEYGITKKMTLGLSVGYDKCTVSWGEKLGPNKYNDTWSRYQMAVRWNYYFVRNPFFNVYCGAQAGGNYHTSKLSGPDPVTFKEEVAPVPLSIQLHIGVAYYIKKKTGINLRTGFGVASDYFTIGISRKF